MNILDIQKHFKDGNFNSVYIFTGNDISLMNNYIDKLHKVYDRIARNIKFRSIYAK